MPNFTIITVCLNNLEGLKKTYHSIQSQTIQNYEWIIIDGESNDGTIDFLKNLNSSSIYWSSEPDKGLYDAMNKGISLAKGGYIIFLNSGDELSEGNVLTVVNDIINNCNPDFIYGDANEKTITGDILHKPAYSHKKVWYGMFTHHQSMFFKRKTIIDNHIFYNLNFSIAADYAFVAKVYSASDSFYYINKTICIFEQGGVSETHIYKALNEQWEIRRDILKIPLFSILVIHILHRIKLFIRFSMPFLYKKLRYK